MVDERIRGGGCWEWLIDVPLLFNLLNLVILTINYGINFCSLLLSQFIYL